MVFQRLHLIVTIRLFCCVFFLASATFLKATIQYTEVTPGNTSGLTGGAAPWTERTPYGSASSVWEARSSGRNDLATTLTGLSPGASYKVSLFSWDPTGINGSSDWHIDATFTNGSGWVNYSPGGPNSEQAYDLNLVNPIVGVTFTSKFTAWKPGLDPAAGATDETSNRDMWVYDLGTQTADASGEITIYTRWDHSKGARSWLDGFGTELLFSSDAPNDITLSGTTVNKTALIGTLIGTLTTIDPTPGDTFTYSLIGGPGSEDNGYFVINGDRLEIDRDLSGLVGPLSIRIRSADAANEWTEKFFSIDLINDSDLDGLDDTWELSYFADLTMADASGDGDGDFSLNSDEFTRGTNPTDSDTDGDLLLDGHETDTGVFVSATDTGTDPLLPDTDGDSIDDNVEITGGNGHITDPTLYDSDGDGFSDSLELSRGTDPTNAADYPLGAIPFKLNEILARNDTDLKDGFGNREDWIEIYNPNTTSTSLAGYYLTDDPSEPTKWSFPTTVIPAGGYLLVFASGKDLMDPDGNPHCNFSLSAGGEYLAIVRPNGTSIDDSFALSFPEQFTDISYGRDPGTNLLQFYDITTPGEANGSTGYPGVVKDTNFSDDRGMYSSPFQLVISSDTPEATIRYTTDGSRPTVSNGAIYNPASPIDITTTTTVRAIAYKPGYLPTNVDTHTYIFLDDVVQQPSNPPGWPTDWTNGVPSDYEMDPRVVNDTSGLGVYTVQEALFDLPTVSISMDLDDFVGSSNGIYSHPQSRWERECAVEYIHPDGRRGFQEDCKIEVHGNSSRNPGRMQKHSLRLTFSSTVGTPKLRYRLFPESDVEVFNKLVLRACFTDSWALTSWATSRYRPNDSMYMRDVWMKESLGAMGQPSSYGNFVHVYVNGLYFGMHNLTERLEDDWYADHLGGDEDDWQINKDLSGNPSRWSQMMAVLNGSISDNSVYETAKTYIDVVNYADYMLLHFFADSEDWPHHNGYAAANVDSHDGRFRFFVWDQEIALDKFSWNRYNNGSGGGAPFQRLRQNAEFRILFADRVQKHLFNGGALSETEAIRRFLAICGEIDKAIVAESARWGDVQATTPYGSTAGSSTNVDADYYPPTINAPIYFTREQHWVNERDNVTGHYIPTLHDQSDSRSLIRELRNGTNLFPSIDAPVFAQHGGVVSSNHSLVMTAGAGNIYFTFDGSDPREVGGSVGASATRIASGGSAALTQTGIVKARALNGGEWSALTEAEFIVGVPASAGSLVVTEIYYNPPGSSEETEFLELMNIDTVNSIDLTDVSITGVDYTFPSATILDPLERILVVKNQIAFAAANNTAGLRIASGEFSGSLDNKGEELALIAQDGVGDIQRFVYDEAPAWPTSADGDGFSLVLISPQSDPDHSDPMNWRSSTVAGGNPGRSDAAAEFNGSPEEDLDGDQLNAFMEHAMGTNDKLTDPGDAPQVSFVSFDDGMGTMREYLTITYQRNLAADDVVMEVQVSNDLEDWSALGTTFVTSIHQGNGKELVTYRSLAPVSANSLGFIRLKAQKR